MESPHTDPGDGVTMSDGWRTNAGMMSPAVNWMQESSYYIMCMKFCSLWAHRRGEKFFAPTPCVVIRILVAASFSLRFSNM